MVAIGAEELDMEQPWAFELKISLSGLFTNAMLIGIAPSTMHVGGSSSLLGSTKLTWGWREDGDIVHNGNSAKYSKQPFTNLPKKEKEWVNCRRLDCRLGVEYNPGERTLSFWDDGDCRGVAFVLSEEEIKKGPFFPAFCCAADQNE
eukprot:CAMPEP_0201498170 /NCGR_PEP_ID=MMETSP0151_2-20130828/69796_1 /ASSEMBLY_ACC=CAM_ASM_000257 /TAXON_ID=200890 /ORGANISM="Paramoeba atlantica, Strain 621/1 / CCAP 1560/9" /LENGTH=146 /DNA_ID=CAMNT_0047889553 /DNA_START=90 /DNA_END=527 /DNA_ORIENTATION=+